MNQDLGLFCSQHRVRIRQAPAITVLLSSYLKK